jgi:hypothetical protein
MARCLTGLRFFREEVIWILFMRIVVRDFRMIFSRAIRRVGVPTCREAGEKSAGKMRNKIME